MSEHFGRGRRPDPAQGIAGEAIRAYREGKGMSLSELARRTEMTKSQLSAIERGLSSPTVRMLERIAAGLDADLDVLFEPQERKAS